MTFLAVVSSPHPSSHVVYPVFFLNSATKKINFRSGVPPGGGHLGRSAPSEATDKFDDWNSKNDTRKVLALCAKSWTVVAVAEAHCFTKHGLKSYRWHTTAVERGLQNLGYLSFFTKT